jgi:hypothetical protein
MLKVYAPAALALFTACGGGSGSAGGSAAGSGTPSGGTAASWLPPTVQGAVATAVLKGDALGGPTADDYIDAALATIEYRRTQGDPLIRTLYNLAADGTDRPDGSSLGAVSWNPSHDAALLRANFGVNTEVLLANTNTSGGAIAPTALAVAGTLGANGRYLVMAGNPWGTWSRGNAQMDQFMKNAFTWLTGKPSSTPMKVALAQLDETYWFRMESTTRAWLTAMYGAQATVNPVGAYDGANLAKIITDGQDLVILGSHHASTDDPAALCASIQAILAAGIPVLYLQEDGGLNDLGTNLFSLLQVQYAGDNQWTNAQASNLDGATLVGRLPQSMTDIREMLTRLKSGAYDFTLPTAQTTDHAGFLTEFGNGATAVSNLFHAYDSARTDIFQAQGLEIPKLLALLGDRLRQDIAYPLVTSKAVIKDFLRADYGSLALYNVRKVVPPQPDLGTFSRTDFTKVTPVTRTVSLVSRPAFQATGAYALPGRTVTLTRTDTGDVKTWVFVNSLRAGSTHLWDDTSYGGFCRPDGLQTQRIPIASGETVYLTSPYGGPLEIAFDVKDVPVAFTFSNVGEHPYWAGPADDATFTTKVDTAAFDWVEVATQGFEVHSKADRFKTGTLGSRWSTPALLGAAVRRYTYDFTHILAGFQGDGIDQEPEVYGWTRAQGLDVPTTDVVKHMNADVPLCGDGCSGNPYDADWAFSPIGHGDLHELGHSLQSGRWQLNQGGYTYANHAGTNFYSYYSQSRYYDDTQDTTFGHQNLPMKAMYQQLQAAYAAGDRAGTVSPAMKTFCVNTLSQGGDSGIYTSYTFYVQFMMQVRALGLLNNGWHMMGRIHGVDRAFNAALADAVTWDARKAAFGFGHVAFADAKTMNNTDFMAIAMSFTTGLDIRDYMAMWGFDIGAAASAQIASFNLPAAERAFFAVKDTDWPYGALTTRTGSFRKLAVDGVTAWPY